MAAEELLDLVVESVDAVAEDVRRLVLRSTDGDRLPHWSPGAHVDLLFGEFTRQYSLCGDPDDAYVWEVAVLREAAGRGGSDHLHRHVRPGDVLRGRGPRNHFELEKSPHYVFIAGGIGITPLLPMIRVAETYGSSWSLAYGGRSRSTLAFADELVESYGDRVTLFPQDETGLLDLAAIVPDGVDDQLVYCCGPEPLLRAVEQHCAGRPGDPVRLERFAPEPVGEPVRAGSFEVELGASGRVLEVAPNRSVLEVLEDDGIEILSSCREGTCGTCETVVLSGEVDHRDSLLTEAERRVNDVMFVCVSRAVSSRLVLEL